MSSCDRILSDDETSQNTEIAMGVPFVNGRIVRMGGQNMEA